MATVEVIDSSEKTLRVRMTESGLLMIWNETATPKAEGYEFRDIGNGLYLSNIPVGTRDFDLVITK